ncbi:PRC-barrel domain-containing protein [Metabacillus litoralis]|uniref:PRC-barrel domain-containing protein n=1 Tax=Metabacillus litoralis TaxID=152268 RepID=UPI000EF567DA|nr:PRC-barrel domain-containing protein [Metabacillus litoralis]MCM3159966.1 PRC-barrel domain-containing protein [Metabacillus litoralis]MCM3408550.1 PRC-barrel domain-containing protein [Metabacillus litoralis]
MKKAKELLHLPIISISEGKQLGMIKDLIINPDEKSVNYLIIGQDDWQVSLDALSYDNVVGVGDSAVMIEQKNSILGLEEIPFLNKMVPLIGSQVITKGGEHSGVISDYYFNEENGHLESLLIHSANNKFFLPIENVLFLGKERVITNESLSEMIPILESDEQLGGKAGNKSNKKDALKGMLNELILNELPKLSKVNNEKDPDSET